MTTTRKETPMSISLADLQAKAVAVLKTMPDGLAREARQIGAELQLIAAGTISSYQPISRSIAAGSRAPATGDRFPAHHELTARLAQATSTLDVESAVTWARQEHTAILHAPVTARPLGETPAQRAERIATDGEGLPEAEAAARLSVTCRQVREARRDHGRDLYDGWPLRPEQLAPSERGERARELARQGIPATVIAQRLATHVDTIRRDLGRRAA